MAPVGKKRAGAEGGKGGRPTLEPGTASTIVSVRLPATLHDRAIARAKARCGGDLSALIRTALEREVDGFVSQKSTITRKSPY